MNDLGLKTIEAEWWILCELLVKRDLDYELILDGFDTEAIKKWKYAGVETLKDIYEASCLMILNPDLSVEELAKWWKAGIAYDADRWKEHGIEVELARKWGEVGVKYSTSFVSVASRISPEEFKELLDRSLCEPDELLFWIYREDYNTKRIREWLSVDMLDVNTCIALEKGGFEPDKLKQALKNFSMEYILKKVEEGVDYKTMITDWLKKQTASLFKRKVKL